MSLIRLRDVSKRFGRRSVPRNVFFRLEEGARVGLIGNNGSGKTTVLRMILGREDPSEGQIERDEELRTGYSSQFSELSDDVSIEQVLNDLPHPPQGNRRQTPTDRECPVANTGGNDVNRLLKQYELLMAKMEAQDGLTYQHRIDTVLSKLGFSAVYRRRAIGQLSGGWRNRAALARILLEAPDVLLD